jgi:coenzyme F420 hydrogenase subunit alpha
LGTITIAPTTRNEGHGKFVLEVDDGGIVTKGFFMSLVLVRGFEKFLVGRAMEFAPVATSRFCGLCPPTHATASSEAIEHSLGVSPPLTGLRLRSCATSAITCMITRSSSADPAGLRQGPG